MLNTMARVNGQMLDFWQADEDVSDWLVHTGWLSEPLAGRYPVGALLAVARHLREVIRVLVEARKTGRPASTDALNVFLRQAPSHPVLVWEGGTPRVERLRPADSVEQCLAPLAEAAAQLLAEGDFQRVRMCEHPGCTLWFHDRTKSHRRRWCSMATCGNRHKVAEYRKRQQG
ncbi:CGNR zinc finger domain-containing protein [Ralstonia sp. 21MJYT02-11]|uniref:CGNR zinc finger domain-containing protein n=2 Tax=Ralstonia soli TaxID=2953896 RepID=A0ABT1APQ3_9RALS|nr:CGNR zinc finger domain-containing protein [Ralstonia soli]